VKLAPIVMSMSARLSVCLSVHLHNSKTTRPKLTIFVHVARVRGSVLLMRCCDTLRTSGFVDSVMFSRNGPTKRHAVMCISNQR